MQLHQKTEKFVDRRRALADDRAGIRVDVNHFAAVFSADFAGFFRFFAAVFRFAFLGPGAAFFRRVVQDDGDRARRRLRNRQRTDFFAGASRFDLRDDFVRAKPLVGGRFDVKKLRGGELARFVAENVKRTAKANDEKD